MTPNDFRLRVLGCAVLRRLAQEVFFTRIVGLSAAEVGLGMSLSGLVVLALSVPLGRLADRVGAQRLWALGSAVGPALFTFLALTWGTPGWALIALVAVVAAAVAHPAARAAERHLHTHSPGEVAMAS